jgi:microcin C transport system substrate-binding protein
VYNFLFHVEVKKEDKMRFMRLSICVLFFGIFFGVEVHADSEGVVTASGLSMWGEAKYGEDFRYFDYVNPEAPKGGRVVLGLLGTFDSMNPFIIRGTSSSPVSKTIETLMTGSLDEPFSQYGLLAEKVRYKEDGSWIEFILREEARFHDGSRVRAEDVAWTYETLTTKGLPSYRYYYSDVDRVEVRDSRTVRFYSKNVENRELFLILGQLPVLSKSWWEGRDFERPLLDVPLGSGVYRISGFEVGRYVELELAEDYWGKDLAVNVGRNNFGKIRYDYYRDSTVMLEAFLAGHLDYRFERVSRFWATAYETSAVKEGLIVKRKFSHNLVAPVQGFVLNLRQVRFQDVRVRKALNLAYDFEDTNRTLTYGLYARTRSYFDNSELSARGLPEGRELELLEPYRDRLPREVFEEEFVQPNTDSEGGLRKNLVEAAKLLKEAGYEVRDGVLEHKERGDKLDIELLVVQPAFQPHALAYSKNLEKLGIRLRIRTLDVPQYIERLNGFDYDMIVMAYGQSLSPGNEQRSMWGSDSASREGGRNYMGLRNEVVDLLIEEIVNAEDREGLIAASRALDRVLQWGHYMVMMFYSDKNLVSYWDRFLYPEPTSLRGTALDLWWVDAVKDGRLDR